jgi:hypothetical protein
MGLNPVPDIDDVVCGVQGIIGDTFNAFPRKSGVQQETPLVALPKGAPSIYPVFPPSHYSLTGYYAAPRFVIPYETIYRIIAVRRAGAAAAASVMAKSRIPPSSAAPDSVEMAPKTGTAVITSSTVTSTEVSTSVVTTY